MKAEMKLEQLSAKQVDQLAVRRNELKARQEQLDQEFEALDAAILACVENQGELAEKSAKTRVVEGSLWDLRATWGEETKIDQKKARNFMQACPRAMAKLIFRSESKLVLIQSPDRLPGGADLPIATRRLFQEAVQVKPKSPRIEIRSRLAKDAQPS